MTSITLERPLVVGIDVARGTLNCFGQKFILRQEARLVEVGVVVAVLVEPSGGGIGLKSLIY